MSMLAKITDQLKAIGKPDIVHLNNNHLSDEESEATYNYVTQPNFGFLLVVPLCQHIPQVHQMEKKKGWHL
ncbi:hypothetical protein A0J61_08920 [Choanephora cucurbitarum]|uniref:Uncharacterized protein n=1 Tax=Choanephora cucurbitarum TaxID=101091 RepID=A0A1C7N1Q9_9FUNG|nr:hypothetical protein A0J61_08920 [Choanephora cucurbitarum]